MDVTLILLCHDLGGCLSFYKKKYIKLSRTKLRTVCERSSRPDRPELSPLGWKGLTYMANFIYL